MSEAYEPFYKVHANFYDEDLHVNSYAELENVFSDCVKNKGVFYLFIIPDGWDDIGMMRYFYNEKEGKFELNLYVFEEKKNTLYYCYSDGKTEKTIAEKLMKREKIDLSSLDVRPVEYLLEAFVPAEEHLAKDHVLYQSDTLILMNYKFYVSDKLSRRALDFFKFINSLMRETDVTLFDADGKESHYEKGCNGGFLSAAFGCSSDSPNKAVSVMTHFDDKYCNARHDPFYKNEAGYNAYLDDLYERMPDKLKEQVTELMRSGQKMRAVKMCRDDLRLGLKDSMKLVERHFE